MRQQRLAGLILTGLILSLMSCEEGNRASSIDRTSNPSTAPAEQKVQSPFLFKEAKLPRDFPPPGPVGTIIVKDYPAYRLARVRSGQAGASGGPNGMFRPLFNHISRNDIPMTAPVEIGYPDRIDLAAGKKQPAESMAFLYGEPSWGRLGVDSADARVVVEDVPAMTFVSIGVRGDYTDDRFADAIDKLTAWVQAHQDRFRIVGPPRYLGYNSPFVLGFLRYGEVQLPVSNLAVDDQPR